MSRLKPLENLLEFLDMGGERFEYLLRALPSDQDSSGGDDEEEKQIDKVVNDSQKLTDCLFALLQSCADDEDEYRALDRTQELQMIRQALHGNPRWKDFLKEEQDDLQHGQRADEATSDQLAWLSKGSPGGEDEDEDEFADEIMAVGTELQLVCKRCGKTFTEETNRDTSCRQHPGLKQLDASWNSIWSCCRRRIDAPGCILCKHERAIDNDAEPDSEESD